MTVSVTVSMISDGSPLPMTEHDRLEVFNADPDHYVVVRHIRYNESDELMCVDRITYAKKSSPIGVLCTKFRPVVILQEAGNHPSGDDGTTEAYIYWGADRND